MIRKTPSETIYVAAQLTAKSDQISALMERLQTLAQQSRQESGCLEYHFYQSTTVPTQFTSFEQWRDAQSEAAHWQTAHVREAIAAFPDLLDGEATITQYQQII
ncbi:MAG: putative quinol monooxygenase [Leptolyngbyaceae cyanobacterium]